MKKNRRHLVKTHHAKEQLKARGVADDSFVVAALKHGYSVGCFRKSEFKNYLLSRASKGKRLKVYKGWVFVFTNTSNKLITAYPIKDRYRENYERYLIKLKFGVIRNGTKTNSGKCEKIQ